MNVWIFSFYIGLNKLTMAWKYEAMSVTITDIINKFEHTITQSSKSKVGTEITRCDFWDEFVNHHWNRSTFLEVCYNKLIVIIISFVQKFSEF